MLVLPQGYLWSYDESEELGWSGRASYRRCTYVWFGGQEGQKQAKQEKEGCCNSQQKLWGPVGPGDTEKA